MPQGCLRSVWDQQAQRLCGSTWECSQLWQRGKDKGHVRPGFGGAGRLPQGEILQRARSREQGDDGCDLQPRVERRHRGAPPPHLLCPGPPSTRCPPSLLLCRHSLHQLQTQDLPSGVIHALEGKSPLLPAAANLRRQLGRVGGQTDRRTDGQTLACSRVSDRAGWLCLSPRTGPSAASAGALACGVRAAPLAGIPGAACRSPEA